MAIHEEAIAEFIKECENPHDVLVIDGLLEQLTKATLRLCLGAGLDVYLGNDKHNRKEERITNSRH